MLISAIVALSYATVGTSNYSEAGAAVKTELSSAKNRKKQNTAKFDTVKMPRGRIGIKMTHSESLKSFCFQFQPVIILKKNSMV
jgi:hypothetical protein